MKKSLAAAVSLLSILAPSLGPVANASAYDGKPKLVIVLVFDQFRGDYLDRFRDDFKTPNGFNLFLKQSAYFPECYYGYANTMTAPGHSSIGTGAYTNGHNIAVNDWWDLNRSTTHMFSSVDDADYPLVGAAGDASSGASPRNELASTLGDEVVLGTGGKAHLFGVSLKDRAAILTSGHASEGAYWIDHANGRFITSTYWRKELPQWVVDFNDSPRIAEARKRSGATAGDFYEKVGATPAGVQYELDFAEALIANEKLGQHDTTDVLTLSISSTDILGHQVGPDDPRQRALIDAIDPQLNDFVAFLQAHIQGGMQNVWIAVTGDHGVSPSPAMAWKEGMPAATFSPGDMNKEIDKELNAKLSPKEHQRFILGGDLPYIQLDWQTFEKLKISEAEAEQMVADLASSALDKAQQDVLKAAPDSHGPRPAILRHIYTKTQIAAGQVPNTEEGNLIQHSYTTNGGWWIMVTPGIFQMSGGHGGTGTNHYTPYSYDRHVPLAFYGSPFKPGTYLDPAQPVDIAATFAALLRVNMPSAAVGKVHTEALKPVAEPTSSRR